VEDWYIVDLFIRILKGVGGLVIDVGNTKESYYEDTWDKMTTYFASDFHFHHKNIVGPKISSWNRGYRDFDSIHDMNCAITTSINNTVGYNDELRFLGDWSFGGIENVKRFRDLIICQNIHLIYGNHDTHIRKNTGLQDLFSSCKDYDEIIVNNKFIVLSHYAFRIWNKSHRESYHFHGHSHHALPNYKNSLDVGWCKWRQPLTFKEIDKIIQKNNGCVPHTEDKNDS